MISPSRNRQRQTATAYLDHAEVEPKRLVQAEAELYSLRRDCGQGAGDDVVVVVVVPGGGVWATVVVNGWSL